MCVTPQTPTRKPLSPSLLLWIQRFSDSPSNRCVLAVESSIPCFTLRSVRRDCRRLRWAADDAETVFNESAVGQLMQYIHHLVVTTDKRLEDSSRLRDV